VATRPQIPSAPIPAKPLPAAAPVKVNPSAKVLPHIQNIFRCLTNDQKKVILMLPPDGMPKRIGPGAEIVVKRLIEDFPNENIVAISGEPEARTARLDMLGRTLLGLVREEAVR
jgi:hypothetical protein